MSENKSTGEKIHLLGEFAEAAIGLMTLFMVVTGNKHLHGAKTWNEKKRVVAANTPNIFGLGMSDERAAAGLLVAVGIDNAENLKKLRDELSPGEWKQFRLIFTGIKAPMETGNGKDQKNVEFTDDDIRVKFLVQIANLVKKDGAGVVAKMLRDFQFVSGDSKSWQKAAAHFIGLADIGDLADPNKVVQAINGNIRAKLQAKLHEIDHPTSRAEAIFGRLFDI